MFKTVQEAVVFVKELRQIVHYFNDIDIVVAPPFTALHAVADATRNTNIGVSAQDVYFEPEGAFTGEISPGMIKEAGASYVIVGHSERRRLFGESDQIVNRKAAAAAAAELIPIVCVGETLEERGPRGNVCRARPPDEARLEWARARSGRCVRASLGHWHRPERDRCAGRGSARAYPGAAGRDIWRRGGG